MHDTPTQGGWYRCCIYASAKKQRGVHQFAMLVTPDMVHPDFAPAKPPYVLMAGQAEPVPVDMVASWGEQVDPFGRKGAKDRSEP